MAEYLFPQKGRETAELAEENQMMAQVKVCYWDPYRLLL